MCYYTCLPVFFRPVLRNSPSCRAYTPPAPPHFPTGLFMNLRLAFVSLAALGLAACSADMVAPTKTPASPSFSKSVDGSSADGDYLVLTSGSAIDPSFEGRVKNLGGKIKTRHDAAGFAVVTGLTEATAAALATMPGVAEITPDVQISLNLPA